MTRTLLFSVGFGLFISLTIAERIRYDNYQVYNVIPSSKRHMDVLRKLDAASDSIVFLNGISTAENDIHVVVAPHKEPDFISILNTNSIPHRLIEKNLQRHLDAEFRNQTARSAKYEWNRYHTLEETYSWLDSLVKDYSENVEVIVAGKSYEGREIRGVKLSYGQGRKGIFIEGGIHAREWISPATVTYIINELLTSSNPEVRKIAEGFDWYIIPHTNPDGYVYTHEKDRLWRKTRSPQGRCYGTDPNRNWDFHWNEVGASSNPCSETFAGKSAFSEIETKTVSDYLSSLKGKLHTYLSFHSYSQLLLFPYGHTNQHAKNHNDLQQVGDAAAKALAQRYGTRYTVGNVYETIYAAAGASIDWAFGELDIPLTYTYELRPSSGWNGFVLPADQIIPTGEETMDSVVGLLQEATKLGYYEN